MPIDKSTTHLNPQIVRFCLFNIVVFVDVFAFRPNVPLFFVKFVKSALVFRPELSCTWVAGGRILCDYREISCDSAPWVLRLRTATQRSLSTEKHRAPKTIQKPLCHNLDDDEASTCGEPGEESALDEPPEL